MTTDRQQYQKAYRLKHRDKLQKQNAEYRQINKAKHSKQQAEYWKSHPDKKSEKGKRHYQNKKREIHKKRKEKYKANIHHRLGVLLRSRLAMAIRSNQKAGSAVRDLGCSIEEFKYYIQSSFMPGMTWENRSEWHLDHIKPLASFDLTNKSQFEIACNYSNIQPLWRNQNLSKGSKSMSDIQLWHGQKIPIIVLSGEVNSGKSLFPLLIDSECRTKGHEPTTIVWDQEGSCEPYINSLNFDWRDTRKHVLEKVHMQTSKASQDDPRWRRILLEKADVNDSPSASLFRAWYLSVLNTERGKYRVGCVDTWTPIQEGLIDWLKLHPEAFGRTSAQYEKAATLFLWGDVKAMLSYILATDCRLRFQSFVLTVHLKNEWSGGSKTGQRIAEGLDVLDKLATLHLRLDRAPKAKNKEAPRVPSAIVVKERLVSFGATSADDRPILPPRLPEATPDAIRAYIAKGGADFGNLDPAERLPDTSMSADQAKLLEAQIAADQRAAAESRVEAERMSISRIDMMRAAAPAVASSIVYAGTTTGVVPAPVQPKPLATQSQIAEFVLRAKSAFANGEEAALWLTQKFGRPRQLAELTEAEILDATSAVCEMVAAKKVAAANANLAASGTATSTSGATPLATPATADQPPAMATEQQRNAIRELSEKCGITQEQHLAYLESQKAGSYRSITTAAAAERISVLRAMADSIPF